MLIRQATLSDLPQLVELADGSATAAHWTEPQYVSALSGAAPRRLVLVLESDRIHGFAVAVELAGEWELENIVIDDAHCGKGLGFMLLKAVLEQVSSHRGERIFLEVRESNLHARGLYEKSGFSISGRRPGYYHNPPEDAILYAKNLTIAAPEIG